MPRFGFLRFSGLLEGLRSGLLRIDVMVLYPILALIAVGFGEIDILLVTAFLLPALLALQAFARSPRARLGGERPAAAERPHGLPTRASLMAMLDRIAVQSPAEATAAIMVHIDELAGVTERWGGETVDDILLRAADRLRAALRHDDMIARIGEAGFGIVLHPVRRASSDVLLGVIERMETALRQPFAIGGSSAHISASFGYCTLDMAPAPTGKSMLDAAEEALAEARGNGPSAVRAFSRELGQHRRKGSDLADGVKPALASGEIRAWYQPQICTDTGVISGFEALARWHHPEHGVLPPGEFLHAVAAAQQMARLGEVMLYNALAALRSWDRAGLSIPSVAVNFSAEELRDPRLADRIKWDVDRFDLRPGRLTVEILETVAAQSEDDIIIRNIEMLGSHGFNLDLDDFGTGQASIANIQRFNVNRIKIDRSFVARLDKDPKQQSMVSAILSLAEHLGVATLAEGVETPGEYSMLAQLGCGHVQGFGIARPMPFEDTIAWAAAHTAKLADTAGIGRQAG
ncbi:putative bifunctional diguanylate cyclase/phosphodiesterase [Rhodophyticola porphyridii]|nr:GGDEF domain-containing phosphodiesterase [Rhodophyticola porphyridii]